MNIGRLSIENLDRFGTYDLLTYEGEHFSNRILLSKAAGLADVLLQKGIEFGDFIMVCMPNSPWVMVAFQAGWKIGATPMPVMPQLLPHELSYMLRDSGAKAVLTAPALAEKLAIAVDEAGSSADILVLGDEPSNAGQNITAEISTDAEEITLRRISECADDDLALLLYTSGTTGNPKGVMLTHGNLNAVNRATQGLHAGVEPFLVGLQTLPLSHSFGVNVMNTSLMLGARIILLPRFEAGAALSAIETHHVYWMPAVPTMLSAMLEHPKREMTNISSLAEAWSGGATLPNELRMRFEQAFGCQVLDGYGQTECAPLATCYRRGEAFRPGSVGRAVPGVEITIRDDADQEIGAGEWGEICIRGANVMKGYLNKPEATLQTLQGGWLRSGDIGCVDDDGYVYITDRKKDLIIKGGENISPREIEEVILTHPSVAEVAVIGVPDTYYGETIFAAIVRRAGTDVSADELIRHAGNSLTAFKLPSSVQFFDTLPKSGVGKTLKRELRAQLTPP